MTMDKWAEQEVKIGCKKENPDWDGKSFDYGCSCYKSALKAFKSLCEDGHSGYSFGFTKNILIRLMEGLPLTPIEDTEDVWTEIEKNEEYTQYQCTRMSSLFKYVYKDGAVKYRDTHRAVMIEKDTGHSYYGSLCRIVDDKFPITMPYSPDSGKYKLYVDEFSAKGFEGDAEDFNTRAVLYCVTPDHERKEINVYYGEKDGKLVEISKEEYAKRLVAKVQIID